MISCIAGAVYQEDGEHRRALFPEPCISQQGCPRVTVVGIAPLSSTFYT